MRMLLTMRPAVPMIGRRQRPMTAVTMNSSATTAAMPARIARPGMTAFTSEYAAPVMSCPLAWLTTEEYWSSQMLTPCSRK
ncbi:hypothetical protein CMsap09_06155 [Clavibacter michiganensis]|uniref:Uncharacterized protein n=1 Tax=Clavibacter michiganensis TaxID=28447 RepID=A0A251XSM4_9MICO|nr:hypothetical protein CMsap09_06155 [Clavibacter michiganensis]